jgi:hypothetical protein
MMTNRRKFITALGTLSVGTLAGCSGDSEDNELPADTDTPSDTGTLTETESSTGDETPTESDEPNYETPDDYRFFVDQSGNGDFEQLQEAFDLMENGDSIKLAAGEYEGTLENDVTLVGEGANETTVELVLPDNSQTTADSENRNVKFYDFTLNTESVLSNAVLQSYGIVLNGEASQVTEAIDSEFNQAVETTTNAVLEGSVFNSRATINSYYEHNAGAPTGDQSGNASSRRYIEKFSQVDNCEFNSTVNVVHENQLNDSFNSTAMPPKEMYVRNSEINDVIELNGKVQLQGCDINNVRISNDVIKKEYNTINLKKRIVGSHITNIEFVENNISIKLTDCEVEPEMQFTEDEKMSIEIESSRVKGDISIGGNNDLKLTNSAVVNGSKLTLTSGTENIIRNHFCGIESGYYIEGTPNQVTANAFFDGGDILINGDTTVFSDGIGNYYETYEETDSEDGIIRIPREIPGEGEVIDQYPLASSDLSQYTSVPDSASRC